MAETMKLLPCPFCGGEATWRKKLWRDDVQVRGHLGCGNDECFGPQTTAIGDDAVVQWNTRATTPMMGEELAALAGKIRNAAQRLDPTCRPALVGEDAFRIIVTSKERDALLAILSRLPAAGDPSVRHPGWIVANAACDRFRIWDLNGPDWTTNKTKALRFARRSDAEAFAAEDEDAWKIIEIGDADKSVALTNTLVREVMTDAWNDFCSDAQAHPDDIVQNLEGKSGHLGYRPRQWTHLIATRLIERVGASQSTERDRVLIEHCAIVADRIADNPPPTPAGRQDDWQIGVQDGGMEIAAAIRAMQTSAAPSRDR